jgi:Ca2+-transporting ATPase
MELITAATMNKKSIEKALATDIKRGLSEKEAERRLLIYGSNIIEKAKKRTILDVIIAQFRNSILWLLIIATIISIYINQYEEAIAITIAIIITIAFGSYLEYKADKSTEELSTFLEERVMVIRDNEIKLIESSKLVPGDIILVNAGQKIPADSYLIESADLEVSEATLTGESNAIKKKPTIMKKPLPIYKLKNILFANSHVLKGNGKAIVIKTGKETEIGKIAEKLKIVKQEEIGLYKDLEKISKNISISGLLILAIIIIIGLWKNLNIPTLMVFALTLAVAVVPEGLTTVLTIMLGLNVKRMAENNALIRRLSAIENLGRIEIVAMDKTGTITKGKMALVSIYCNGKIYDENEIKKLKCLCLFLLKTNICQ